MRHRSFNRRHVVLGVLGAAGCALAARSAGSAAPAARFARQGAGYSILDLGGFGRASGINGSGQVVGLSGSTAAMWEGTQWLDLGTWPGDASSEAFAINDDGVVVGASWSSSYQPHAVVWTQGQVFDLGTLPGGTESVALAINGRNQVVGWSAASDGGYHAVRWDLEQGQIFDLGTVLDGFRAEATGINDSDVIVGWAETDDGTLHAVHDDGSGFADLGSSSLAFGINSMDKIAGVAEASDGNDHAVVWAPEEPLYLGAEGIASRATAINDDGLVVGAIAEDGPESAVVWDDSGQEFDLKGLQDIDPTIESTAAYGINASGQIVGESGGRPVVWNPE